MYTYAITSAAPQYITYHYVSIVGSKGRAHFERALADERYLRQMTAQARAC